MFSPLLYQFGSVVAVFSVAADATIEIMTQIPTQGLAIAPEAISFMVVVLGLRYEGWPEDSWTDGALTATCCV